MKRTFVPWHGAQRVELPETPSACTRLFSQARAVCPACNLHMCRTRIEAHECDEKDVRRLVPSK